MGPPYEPWAEPAPTPSTNKKPRHRHSPVQLAALNELFDQNEHPPLDQRTALADRLGMETKTVNAWFQNKRASSKKRVRGGPPSAAPPLPSTEAHPESYPQPPPHSHLHHHQHRHQHPASDFARHLDMDDFHDDEGLYLDVHHSRSASIVPSDYPSGYYAAAHPEHSHFYQDSDNTPRRMRMRPSPDQTDELRKLYNINPHPTTEQRQALSAAIGMRYQSITNWFQNQRSLAKKRKDDEPEHSAMQNHASSEYSHDSRQYSAYPPLSHSHPSLGLPPHTNHPSLGHLSSQRSPSVSPSMDDRSPRRSSSHRSTTPYGSMSATFSRPRRSRPEPYQLDALKELFTKSATPTIEERSALALEIGMDVGKVTNWFRNLRQTARKRAKKSGSGDDEDDDVFMGMDPYSTSASRFGTPSFGSSSSSVNDEPMDMDDYDMHVQHRSENGSEDEYQEAVTPSPDISPSPPPLPVETQSNNNRSQLQDTLNLPYPVHIDKVLEKQFSGARVEDALLLLSFHHHVVH